MNAEPPQDTGREQGRAPLLSASILHRIRARCVTRARRYRRNHPGFSSRDEMYFFFGADAVLAALRDQGAEALAKEWLGDFAGRRSPCDQSTAAQAARARDREREAELDALFASMAGAGKDGAK
jgi:hypothetical protein